jgi:hypothetical protein
MSRLPPALLYLTIYNPLLKPSGPVSDDDEDAEEQAHILFYTSRERAVSRDKMLRQVGLAKALISFSEYASISYTRSPKLKSMDMRAQACSFPMTHATTFIHIHGGCSWSHPNPVSGSMQ